MREPLSQEGLRRREAILELARGAARHRRYRRRTVAALGAIGGATCAVLVGISLVANFHSSQPGSTPGPLGHAIAPTQPAARSNPVTVGVIPVDTTVLERWSVLPKSRGWETIGDEDLIESVASAGESAGFIRVDGETTLVSSALP